MQRKRSCLTRLVLTVLFTVTNICLHSRHGTVNALVKQTSSNHKKDHVINQKQPKQTNLTNNYSLHQHSRNTTKDYTKQNHTTTKNYIQHPVSTRRRFNVESTLKQRHLLTGQNNHRTILKLDSRYLHSKHELHKLKNHTIHNNKRNKKTDHRLKNRTLNSERKKRKADPQLPYGPPLNGEMDPMLAARHFIKSTHSNGETFHRFPSPSSVFSQSPNILRRSHLSPFIGERQRNTETLSNHAHLGLRNRLLEALARRINERNLYMRSHGLLPEQANDDMLFERRHMNTYPIDTSMRQRTLAVPFRERLLAANGGMRQLHEYHHRHPMIDPSLLSGELSPEDSASLLSPSHQRMFGGNSNVGNLGDETMPYGSLGETKPEYIPVGRVAIPDEQDVNQELANEEMTEFVPSLRPHKQKKTWVTDVNVYSKKKNEDINSILNDDNDSDPLDEYDPCDKSPCHNGGICKVIGNTEYLCICPRTFKGKRCEIRNRCHPNPCMHGSKCTETNTGFQCSCGVGFKGKRCQERNFCLPNPCMNDGVCTESSSTDGFSCTCKESWYGRICDQRRTACTPSPCMNHGHCFTDGSDAFECVCQKGTAGKLCEDGQLTDSTLSSLVHLFHGDPTDSNDLDLSSTAALKSVISTPSSHEVSKSFICEANPCLNGGICRKEVAQPRGYECQCVAEYHGIICEEKKCMCENGGTCIGEGIEVRCACRSGYGGKSCEEHTQCNEDTCLHGGICIEQVGGFKCKCDSGYKGQRCELYDKCLPNPCLHGGVCRDFGDFYKCECKKGFKGKQCEDIDLCMPNPCHNGGQCFGYPGGFQCECLQGYKGKTCDERIHCLSNPCSNGAECIEVPSSTEHPSGTFKCGCKTGFTGESCEEKDFCYSSPCHNGGSCHSTKDGFSCKCQQKYYGRHCQHINHCYGNPCKNNAKCISNIHDFQCQCPIGFKGVLCDEADYCQPNPCKNGGFCTANNGGTGFNCVCKEGYRGLTCEERNPCAPNPCAHGECIEMAGGYLCNCTTGFKGPKCTEINRCEPNPCFHGGSCEEINGGVGYVCQCAPGYKGEICEKKNLCHPNPCQNGGECSDNRATFKGGDKYSLAANTQTDAIQCTCAQGFRGPRCTEIDPCFPNPCKHSSQCIADGHSPIKCNCSIGYKGDKCDAVDLCSPDPCRYGTHCIQTDEESYQCAKNLCTPNPCHNDGKCIVVNDEGYECACPKGWKGKNCDDQDLCYPNPCENGGICHNMETEGYTCECAKPYAGNKCQIKEKPEAKDFCAAYPCKNGGTCIDTEGGFTCRCNEGFSGPFCEDSVCHPQPCDNGGTCVPYYGIALCKCTDAYTGAHCSESKKPGTVQHSDINTVRMTDTMGQTKSNLPRVTEILKHSGANSPLLIERVEEILNSDADRVESANEKRISNILQGQSKASLLSPSSSPLSPSAQPSSPSSKPQTSPESLVPPEPPKNPPTIPSSSSLSTSSVLTSAQKPTSTLVSVPTTAHVSATTQKTETMEVPTRNGPAYRPVVVIKTLDPCEPNPCLHNGVCVMRSNGESECICPHGFSGPQCKEIGLLGYSSAPKFFPKDECKHCDSNAICVNGHCICQQGFVGDGLECWAESQEDKDWNCDVSPCQNGGTCKPGRAKCVCRLGFVGKFCEKSCSPSVHLSFDSMKGSYVNDESGNHNEAVIKNGVQISYQGGKCDSGAALQGGDILFDGRNFQPKPVDSVTISVWIKLDTTRGIQSIFDTIGGDRSTHKEGQYHFEVDNAKLRWFHRNERHETIFSVLTKEPVLLEGNWTHVVGTYDGDKRIAKIFMNGDLVGVENTNNRTIYLSQDWDEKAGIGKHEHVFGNRLLRGMVDEFFIFPCPLPRIEILVLMHHCKVYWKHNKQDTSQKHEVAGVLKQNTVSSLSPSDVASLKKSKNRYQNYVGFETEIKLPHVVKEADRAMIFTNHPVAEQITVSGNQRYEIPRPFSKQQSPFISQPKNIVQRPVNNRVFGPPTASQVPQQGSSALYEEVREMLAREHLLNQDKRVQISPQDIEKKLAIKLKANLRPRYHHSPVIRNENKDLPFGPHAYLNPQNNPLFPAVQGIVKSTFPTPSQIQQNSQQRSALPTSTVFQQNSQYLPSTAQFLQNNNMMKPNSLFISSNQQNPQQRNMLPTATQQIQQQQQPASFNTNQNAERRQKVNIAGPSAFFGPDSPPVTPSKKSPIPFPFQGAAVKTPRPMAPKPPSFVADPRWFTWSKGLASTSGGTHTNTHTNTLQRNDPGTANVGTKVKSSQNSGGKTSQQSKYNIPQQQQQQNPNRMLLNSYVNNPNHNMNLNKQLAASFGIQQSQQQQQQQQQKQQAFAREQQRKQQAQQYPTVAVQQQQGIVRHQQQQQQQQQGISRQQQQEQQAPNDQLHKETHNHQWGYGNGQGNGNGVGKPGGSGSGGGWGAGGPLSQQVNLPGWGGNPPDGPPWGDKAEEKQKEQEEQQQKNQIYPQQTSQTRSFASVNNAPSSPTFPSNAREVWNSYVAQKKQSESEMHADATNTVWTNAKVNPVTPQHLSVQNHGWGYGNGNGDANGQGAGGGTGDAGGWGAGGPVKQETSLPGHQVSLPGGQSHGSNPPQQKSMIHNLALGHALAQSIKIPLFSKSLPKPQVNINSANPAYDRRSQIRTPPTSVQTNVDANLYQSRLSVPNQINGKDTVTFIQPFAPTSSIQTDSRNNIPLTQNQFPSGSSFREALHRYRNNINRPAVEQTFSPNNYGMVNNAPQVTRSFVPTQSYAAIPSSAQQFINSKPTNGQYVDPWPKQNVRQNIPEISNNFHQNTPTEQINSDTVNFMRETSSFELPEPVRRNIISKAIHDAMNGLKKKKRKKRKIQKKKKKKRRSEPKR